MITITYEKVMAALALFTAACVAAGWLVKIMKALKKPSEDINEKLDRDKKRLDDHDDAIRYIEKAIPIIVRTLSVLCEHLETGNSTGKISKQRDEIQNFLYSR